MDEIRHDDPEGAALSHYVPEGQEVVVPWGLMLEYTDWLASQPGPLPRIRRHQRVRYVRCKDYPPIFISYRREDGEAYAGRLHEALVRTFGNDQVFMDQFSLRPGEVFPWTIQQALWHPKIVLCLMGPKWPGLLPNGRERIASSWDYVRREITAALDLGHCVMPLLLAGGSLPDRMTLTNGLEHRSDLQALSLSQRHWDADMRDIISAISLELKS